MLRILLMLVIRLYMTLEPYNQYRCYHYHVRFGASAMLLLIHKNRKFVFGVTLSCIMFICNFLTLDQLVRI